MASWGLRCPNCNSTFTHSQVEDTLANFYIPAKPTFPVGGETLDCPHCGHNHLYQETDLIYQAAASN
jgi:DNA-directed RNA polymerase subunit RPC12/RpoP